MTDSPEWLMFARTVLALCFVVGLIYLCAALARKTGIDKRMLGNGRAGARLAVVETLYIDARHRLVIARSDDREHVLLLGPAGDLLIENRPARAVAGKQGDKDIPHVV